MKRITMMSLAAAALLTVAGSALAATATAKATATPAGKSAPRDEHRQVAQHDGKSAPRVEHRQDAQHAGKGTPRDEHRQDAQHDGKSTPRVDHRQVAQHARIHQGVKSGTLTKPEARNLRHGQKHVRHVEQRAKADGTVTPRERERVAVAQNHQSKKIYRKKHNARTR
jgi:hypothetical protein